MIRCNCLSVIASVHIHMYLLYVHYSSDCCYSHIMQLLALAAVKLQYSLAFVHCWLCTIASSVSMEGTVMNTRGTVARHAECYCMRITTHKFHTMKCIEGTYYCWEMFILIDFNSAGPPHRLQLFINIQDSTALPREFIPSPCLVPGPSQPFNV